MSVIYYNKPVLLPGENIGTICSSFYSVNGDVSVNQLAQELEKNEKINSIGVVDDEGYVKGILVRKELFDELGRLYGRDVYKHKKVNVLMKAVTPFESYHNIYDIANRIFDTIYENDISYYILEDADKRFFGIFSSKDLLVHLADITKKELRLAKTIQSHIVNEEFYVEAKSFKAVAASKMANDVGGDFYVIKEYSPGKWLIFICDVCGKGISASLITTIISGMMEVYDFVQDSLKKFIVKLNNYIYDTFKLEKFVTGLFIDFDEIKGRVKLYDMGHSLGIANIYLKRADSFKSVKNRTYNLPLGVMKPLAVDHCSFRLNRRDRLVLITDGVTDQRDIKNSEYGIKRVGKIFLENRDRDIKELKELVLDDLKRFKGTTHQNDDITFILLDYLGDEEAI